MQKVFIDTDVILDLLDKREPFYKEAAIIFSLIEENNIKGYTSPIVFANIHYILSKKLSKNMALKNLLKLRNLINIAPINEKIIDQSLNSNFKDYEDSIQYYTAIAADISILITRNVKDYKNAGITICDPQQYLKMRLAK